MDGSAEQPVQAAWFEWVHRPTRQQLNYTKGSLMMICMICTHPKHSIPFAPHQPRPTPTPQQPA